MNTPVSALGNCRGSRIDSVIGITLHISDMSTEVSRKGNLQPNTFEGEYCRPDEEGVIDRVEEGDIGHTLGSENERFIAHDVYD